MQFLDTFRNWAEVQEFAPQTVIFSEREPAEVMYFVLSGEVGLSIRGELLGTEKEGGIIGEMALIESASHSATATSLSQVELARLDRNELRKIVSDNIDFSLHVMAVLANRLRAVDNYIAGQIDNGG